VLEHQALRAFRSLPLTAAVAARLSQAVLLLANRSVGSPLAALLFCCGLLGAGC
jgi:hypothetical protein